MRRSDALAGIPGKLWRMVFLAGRRLLMLDYDGTLAPFRPARMEALPEPQTLARLRRLAESRHTALAIVSGRPVQDLQRLIGPLPVTCVGEHGWEVLAPNGKIVRRPLERSVQDRLDEAERTARRAGFGPQLERKRTGMVLHTRGLPNEESRQLEARCLDVWDRYARDGHVGLDRIAGGVELRALGRHKGTAVLSLMSQSAPGTLGVYLGDDATDEDAFDVVRDWGFGLRVGPSHEPTLALGYLPSADAMGAFLEEWLRLSDGRITRPPVRT